MCLPKLASTNDAIHKEENPTKPLWPIMNSDVVTELIVFALDSQYLMTAILFWRMKQPSAAAAATRVLYHQLHFSLRVFFKLVNISVSDQKLVTQSLDDGFRRCTPHNMDSHCTIYTLLSILISQHGGKLSDLCVIVKKCHCGQLSSWDVQSRAALLNCVGLQWMLFSLKYFFFLLNVNVLHLCVYIPLLFSFLGIMFAVPAHYSHDDH